MIIASNPKKVTCPKVFSFYAEILEGDHYNGAPGIAPPIYTAVGRTFKVIV